MDPQLSGFALGLLLAAAKVGAIGTLGFGIAWWRARRRLRRLEAALPDPAVLNDRLATLEQTTDFMAAKLTALADTQTTLVRQLGAGSEHAIPRRASRDERDGS